MIITGRKTSVNPNPSYPVFPIKVLTGVNFYRQWRAMPGFIDFTKGGDKITNNLRIGDFIYENIHATKLKWANVKFATIPKEQMALATVVLILTNSMRHQDRLCFFDVGIGLFLVCVRVAHTS